LLAATDRATQASIRNIAEGVSLSPIALFRHRAHSESTLVEAEAGTEEADGNNLARKLTELSERARRSC
jgi:hypothetical protein